LRQEESRTEAAVYHVATEQEVPATIERETATLELGMVDPELEANMTDPS